MTPIIKSAFLGGPFSLCDSPQEFSPDIEIHVTLARTYPVTGTNPPGKLSRGSYRLTGRNHQGINVYQWKEPQQ